MQRVFNIQFIHQASPRPSRIRLRLLSKEPNSHHSKQMQNIRIANNKH